MSSHLSLLNASSSSKSEEFNLKDIEILVGKEDHPWFKRACVGQYLGIASIITLTTKLAEERVEYQALLQAERGFLVWIPIKKMHKIMVCSSHLMVCSMSL